MCNPRRVSVTLTRDIAEAWRREVSRTAELSTRVVGTARLRQSLADSVGGPALRALENRLAAGEEGWQAVPEGYRCEVEGGYVLYLADEQVLEIVATLDDSVQAQGEAATVLSGEINTTLSASAERSYYDDGYGQLTEAGARQAAEDLARRTLTRESRQRLEQAQQQAEAAESIRLQAQAEAAAAANLATAAAERRELLSRQAEERLDIVGLHCRRAFNRLLAQAYRDAILAYARRHGAENIQCRDDAETLEIEFLVDG